LVVGESSRQARRLGGKELLPAVEDAALEAPQALGGKLVDPVKCRPIQGSRLRAGRRCEAHQIAMLGEATLSLVLLTAPNASGAPAGRRRRRSLPALRGHR